MQNELEEMSTKGFVFAKLPMCHKMPQIKYWIMYRKGEILTDRQKGFNILNCSFIFSGI